MAKEYDTLNFCAVGVQGEYVRILAPKTMLSRDEAILLAAWLTCMADVLDPPAPDPRDGDCSRAIEEVREAVKAIEAA